MTTHTMLSDNISTLFDEALNKLERISGHPTDSHLTEICKILSQILLVVPYDEENGVHNLVRNIQDQTTYTAEYTVAFPRTSKPAIYDTSIDKNEKAPIHAQKEAIHKARCSNFTTFEAADLEDKKFIPSRVENTWFQELKRANTCYTLVTTEKMLAHLQATSGVIHALNILTLQNEMQLYHLDSKGIPEYINEPKDDQAKAEQENNPITDTTRVIIATNAMVSTEKFSRVNKDWG